MPIVILSESQAEDGEVELIDPRTGELTIEAQAVSEFLTHVDFSAVTALPELADQVVSAKLPIGENEVDVETELIPGELVAEAVDMDDLVEMFDAYLIGRIEAADDEKATLDQRAEALALFRAFAEPIDEAKFPTGRGKMRRAWKGNKQMQRKAVGQMIAMRKKQVYVSKGGKNVKGPGYRGGGTKVGKAAVEKYKGKNKSKIVKAKRMRGVKVESEDASIDDAAIFGLSAPIGQHYYEASPREDAGERVTEAKKKMKGKFGKGGVPMKPGAPTWETPEADLRPRGVDEGAELAGRILNLNEARSGGYAAATKTT